MPDTREDTGVLRTRRIAILVPGLPPTYGGGTEIATVEIARCATALGHDVHVVALDGTSRGGKAYKLVRNGFAVHRIRSIQLPYLYGLAALPHVVITTMLLKPDIIHAQGIAMAPAAYIAAKVGRTPFILYGRGEIYLDWALKRFSHKAFLRRADRVIAQTDNMRQEMLNYCDGPIEVIPNGINAERFGGMPKQAARWRLGMPQNKNVVVSVGRFRPEKNLRGFIDAAALDTSCTTEYLMIGDGPQLSELKNYALKYEHVKFTGAVPNTEIPLYLCAADVLVNTSHSEGFPVSILEAMASGLPVVAPRICGVPEIVDDGVNGVLTIPGDSTSTYLAVEWLLHNRDATEIMSGNNRRKARLYTWENVVRKLYG